MGADLTKAMALNLLCGSTGQSPIAGHIAMLEQEVNSVIKALRQNNLEVAAVHNPMLGDEPLVVFLHYYGQISATQVT